MIATLLLLLNGRKIFLISVICLCLSPFVRGQDRLPRVGTIKDYEATGLTAGCANFYFYFAPQTTKYIFISRSKGKDAWMNLNGRDVSLRQIKFSRQNKLPFRFYYRWQKVLITVFIEDFKSKEEASPMFRMKITLRNSGKIKTVWAVGEADC